MLEKRNIEEKDAAGDAGALDDIVDMAAGKMGRAVRGSGGLAAGPRRRERAIAREALGRPAPETAVC